MTDDVLSSPMAAGLLLQLKAECEAQHARADKAEADLTVERERRQQLAEALLQLAQMIDKQLVCVNDPVCPKCAIATAVNQLREDTKIPINDAVNAVIAKAEGR